MPLKRFFESSVILHAAFAGWLSFAQTAFLADRLPGAASTALCSLAIALLALGLETVARAKPRIAGSVLRILGRVLLAAAVSALARRHEAFAFAAHAWFACTWTLLSSIGDAPSRRLSSREGSPAEGLRWTAMLALLTGLSLPFYTPRAVGAGDAYWYTIMLGDFVTQLREGIFPVWLGQTQYAFAGTFSPLRMAPAFQHLGGLVDCLTAQVLFPTAIVNVTLVMVTFAACASAYATCRALLPSRPNVCAALAVLYVLVPSYSGFLCLSDQYMTCVAAVFLPPAWYALHRAWTRDDLASALLLGASTAALWLAHTPIALWFSALALVVYAASRPLHWQKGHPILRSFQALGAFLLLGSYPVTSVLTLANVQKLRVEPEAVWIFIQSTFREAVMPLTAKTLATPFNVSYATFALLLVGGVLALRRRSAFTLLLSALSLAMLLAVLPVPGLTPWIWRQVPATVLSITNSWPMQRFSPILSALAIALFALELAARSQAPQRHARGILIATTAFVALLLAWSVQQATFAFHRSEITRTAGDGWAMMYQPNNLLPTRYSYVSFYRAPGTFSHGYMNPVFENRLLHPETFEPLLGNADAAVGRGSSQAARRLARYDASAVRIPNSVHYQIDAPMTLERGKHYALRFASRYPEERGYLQIRGGDVFREYMLPDSGSGGHSSVFFPVSFGTTPTSSDVLPLETYEASTKLELTLILPDRPPEDILQVGEIELWDYTPSALPIRLKDLTPYRVSVEAPREAVLESPRVWQSGYRAKVNGVRVPVLRSPNDLAMIPVPAGHSEAEIKYVPPLALELHYWFTLAGWTLALFMLTLWLGRLPEPAPAASRL